MQDQVAEHVGVAKTTVMSYATSGGAGLIGVFTAQEWAAIVAALCALLTAAANIWFKHREDKRAERLASRQLRRG